MHVLIIEDEFLIALNLQWMLEDLGATTAIADTEAAAVSAAEAHAPDLITSDVTLRSGTGPAAVRAIKRVLGRVPVIYVTATPDVCAELANDDQVLRKPVSESSFVDAVKRIMVELR